MTQQRIPWSFHVASIVVGVVAVCATAGTTPEYWDPTGIVYHLVSCSDGVEQVGVEGELLWPTRLHTPGFLSTQRRDLQATTSYCVIERQPLVWFPRGQLLTVVAASDWKKSDANRYKRGVILVDGSKVIIPDTDEAFALFLRAFGVRARSEEEALEIVQTFVATRPSSRFAISVKEEIGVVDRLVEETWGAPLEHDVVEFLGAWKDDVRNRLDGTLDPKVRKHSSGYNVRLLVVTDDPCIERWSVNLTLTEPFSLLRESALKGSLHYGCPF